MVYKRIRLDRQGDCAVITLSNPAVFNAFDDIMAAELKHAVEHSTQGPGWARAILLTGEGRAFCAGASLSEDQGDQPGDGAGWSDAGAALEHTYNPLMTMLRGLDIPIVVAVNGVAAGMGFSLALMGDIVVAAESASFVAAFRNVGLVADSGLSYVLPRLVGRARASEIVMLGQKLPARTAADWGLINRCVAAEELMPLATDIAHTLAAGPASQALIRRQMWESLDAQWADQLAHERDVQRQAGETADFEEGVSAFREKRAPRFTGS